MSADDRRGVPIDAEIVQTWVGPADLARFDRLAAKRGVDRGELLRQAIDSLLAQEALVGGFIPPPPPMLPPPRPKAHPSTWRVRPTWLRRRRRPANRFPE